jgi:cytochrome c-type biogenesis protein CcmH
VPRLLLQLVMSFAMLLSYPATTAHAAGNMTESSDPLLEKRVLSLSTQLRCLVCQNQNLADSHADLAIDLKNQVREKLAAGESEQEVIDYLVERYGDFVLYKPRLNASTWLLWIGPFVLLAMGFDILARTTIASDTTKSVSDAQTEAALQHAAALLDQKPEQKLDQKTGTGT